MLYVLDEYESYSKAYHWSYSICILVHFFSHFLFFIPFLLRSYRLNLIFSIDKNWDLQDTKFKKKMKRTHQKWLLQALAVISTPFVLVSIIVYNLSNSFNFFRLDNSSDSSHYGDTVNAIALGITFVEQLCSIFAINSLRNINDDFNMTKELILVNLT